MIADFAARLECSNYLVALIIIISKLTLNDTESRPYSPSDCGGPGTIINAVSDIRQVLSPPSHEGFGVRIDH
jgi:hypothetical protein